ncbi:MAG: M4 family metallopeptidase [Lachnospiraceae bacterium]|nr:M4 family metallopeptidase [Lachnospiraceae bacterium]
MKRKLMILVLTAALTAGLFTGCGKKDVAETVPGEETTEAAEDMPEESEEEAEEIETKEIDNSGAEGLSDETMEAALSGEGAVTAFIGEPFYDGKIKNDNDALDALYSVVDLIGGDSSTEFVLDAIDNTEDGIDYYTFRQVVGDITVYGAAAKVIVDKNDQGIGVVSSILPELEAPSFDKWAIDAAQAEDIIRSYFEGEKIRIYSEATEQTLIPIMDGGDSYQYTWVVYTDNNFDTDNTDAAFVAHYVSYDGEYLQSIPVTDIANDEALSGSVAEFAFADMESDTWSGTVKTLKGKKKNIEIPIMRDPDTGKEYLGDASRKILCADFADFEFEDTLTPLEAEKGKWDDEAVITYENFIRVYDLYETTGWVGPDGVGTPTVILMNAVEPDGQPMDNACYVGKGRGFQKFAFDTTKAFGECTDVVGHEFTHCFTGTLMTTNLYLNDYGAINEGMSDILGNLTAIMTDDDDVPFIMGENFTDGKMRSMKDPHAHEQPQFVWDKYYVPAVAEGTDSNDEGGVHTNSSLLNYISYKLNAAGMKEEDEFYFWANVARAITPRTDYIQMAEILPWVMKTFGQDEYLGTLEDAIEETGIASDERPETPPEGLAYLSIDLPDDEYFMSNDITASVYGMDGSAIQSWPAMGTNRITMAVSKGQYVVSVVVNYPDTGEMVYFAYQGGEWYGMDEDGFVDMVVNPEKDAIVDIKAGDDKVLDGTNIISYDQDGEFYEE